MEQKSVICSENACIFIYANRDTVLKFSVVSCDFCSFFFLGMGRIEITNAYFFNYF